MEVAKSKSVIGNLKALVASAHTSIVTLWFKSAMGIEGEITPCKLYIYIKNDVGVMIKINVKGGCKINDMGGGIGSDPKVRL